MRTFVLRLAALIALLLMPLGMSAAPAAHHSDTMATMQHCPDQGSKHEANGSAGECTMACASALPATDLSPLTYYCVARTPAQPSPIRALADMNPEIATPPPRQA